MAWSLVRNLYLFRYGQITLKTIIKLHSKRLCTFVDNNNCSVRDYLNTWQARFKEKGISEPKESIEHILAYVLGSKKVTDVYRYQHVLLKTNEIRRLQDFCYKRLKNMPVQYIIQEWDFRDLTLKMSRPVFIPRPETEMLVDLVLNEIERTNKPINTFLEFCCGSGAISLALLKSKPQFHAVVIDKSLEACALTRRNAEIHNMSHRIRIIHGQVELIQEHFDLIVSNPPYIFTEDLKHLQPDIKLYEDCHALDGGPDGMSIIKRILKISSTILNKGGKIYLEVEPSHPEMIKVWLQENSILGLHYVESFQDFCGKDRFVEIVREEL